MKQAEIFSLLSLPCFRFVSGEYTLGLLECQENQVRFVERNRIFSISFYKIENIELRTVAEEPQLIFLTHVGLIVFYFYESTSISHIRYIYDAILGAFVAYKKQTHTLPIWYGRISTWNSRSVQIEIHSSTITLGIGRQIYRYNKDCIREWEFTETRLILPDNTKKFSLTRAKISLLQCIKNALLDGSVQGLWESAGFLQLRHQLLIISESHLYIQNLSWKDKNTIQIELCHIHAVRYTEKGIEIESLTNPISLFWLPTKSIDIFYKVCNIIVQQNRLKHFYLWRQKTLLRGKLFETKEHLVMETHHDQFRWAWNTLCRDDDESTLPHVLFLRTESESIRIHIPTSYSSSQNFYKRYTLPHRRIQWSTLSPAAKRRIFTNRIVHIQSETSVVQIVAHLERKGPLFQIHPVSLFSSEDEEADIVVHFHTEHGQYYFKSRLIQTNEQLFIATPDQISLTSQRYAPRYKSDKKAIFSLLTLDQKTNRLSSSSDTCIAHLINISEGGAGIITSIPLSSTQKLLLDIEDYPQQIICLVRHCTLLSKTEYKVGVQFCALSNQNRKNINEMLQIFVKERH